MELKKVKNRWVYLSNCLLCKKEIFIYKSKIDTSTKKCTKCFNVERNKNNKGKYKYELNKEFFKNKNIISAYWAGFIAADGYISKTNQVCIKIKETDIDRLKQFLKNAKCTHPVLNSGKEDRKRIVITCHEWVKDLEEIYNIKNNKSLTLEPPNLIEEEHIKAFIIGYIDGDGTICFLGKHKYLKLGIVRIKSILEWIQSYFNNWVDNTKAKKQISGTKSKDIFEYVVYGKRAKELILLLKELDINKMERKWSKVQK